MVDERVTVRNHNVVATPIASYRRVGRVDLTERKIAEVITVADESVESVELDIRKVNVRTGCHCAQVGVKSVTELAHVQGVLDGGLLVKSANRLQIHIAGRESHGSQQHH